MTDEEKKEFEEFLKWKAEKEKRADQEKQGDEPVKVVDNSSQKEVDSPNVTISSSDDKKEGNDKGLLILITAFIVVILLLIIVGLSGNKQEVAAPEAYGEIDDSMEIAVVEPDYTNEPTKVEWDFLIEKDEMTDSKNIWASITSDNYVTQDFPYEGPTHARITVRYMKKYGYDVLIQITQGQVNGREYYGTNYITARFDENSPKKYYFNESADGDSKVVFLRKSSDFIQNCKKAKDIKIDIPLYKGGRPVFTFHVDEPLVWRNE